MYHVTSIMFVSSFVCPFDFPGKLAQKSYWWSPPALVDEASQRHRLPDRFAFAVADATLLGFDGVWDLAVCVVCFLSFSMFGSVALDCVWALFVRCIISAA